jgi:hypothetical protein
LGVSTLVVSFYTNALLVMKQKEAAILFLFFNTIMQFYTI